jgi:hypothetical protein
MEIRVTGRRDRTVSADRPRGNGAQLGVDTTARAIPAIAMVNSLPSADASGRLEAIADVAARGDRKKARQYLGLFISDVPGISEDSQASLGAIAARLEVEADSEPSVHELRRIASGLAERSHARLTISENAGMSGATTLGALDDQLTDCSNAERLVCFYRGEVRLAVPSEEWVVFDGTRWRGDFERRIEQLAVATVRSYLIDAANTDNRARRDELIAHAKRSEHHSRIMACVERAKAVPGITIHRTELDKDPAQFNCTSGTLDLHLLRGTDDD